MKYKVGDRVKVNNNCELEHFWNRVGTIVEVDDNNESEFDYSVKFDLNHEDLQLVAFFGVGNEFGFYEFELTKI